MILVQSLSEIERLESRRSPVRPTMILLCRPDHGISSELCTQFRYIHIDSGFGCSIYPAGFLSSSGCNYNPYPEDYDAYPMGDRDFPFPQWWFSDKAYIDLKKELELRMNVEYRGGLSIAILHPGLGFGLDGVFDYENSILIDGDSLVAKRVVSSPIELLQRLVNSAKGDASSREVLKTARLYRRRGATASLGEAAGALVTLASFLLNLREDILARFLV